MEEKHPAVEEEVKKPKAAETNENECKEPGLPKSFSLLSKLNVANSISAEEIIQIAEKRFEDSKNFKPIFEEDTNPFVMPDVVRNNNESQENNENRFLPKTNTIFVVDSEYAKSTAFRNDCEAAPITLVQNLIDATGFNPTLFRTEKLLEIDDKIKVETRKQLKQDPDCNVNKKKEKTWMCKSLKKRDSTLGTYAKYQKDWLKELEEQQKKDSEGSEPKVEKMREILFGTNVDLSADKWSNQLNEIEKLPSFCRITSDENVLSHIEHEIFGMKSVQLYMKVPGARTPAHQENNCFASVNLNIGPGDCEWFGVAYEYWGQIERMCQERGIDYLRDAWWPDMDELIQQNIPVYKFTQKAGDLVYVAAGCVHWVQSTGICNNVAWNVGTSSVEQLQMAVNSYEFNKAKKYQSIVPIQYLCWKIAQSIAFRDEMKYNFVRDVLIRSLSYSVYVAEFAKKSGKQILIQERSPTSPSNYCAACEIEVFNILFTRAVAIKRRPGKKMQTRPICKYNVFCAYCAAEQGIEHFGVVKQFTDSFLKNIYNSMQLEP